MRGLRWVIMFACAGCSAALAAEPYLSDAIGNPTYARALTSLLDHEGVLPAWIGEVRKASGNYVGTPATHATIGETTYEVFHACKAHDCFDHQLTVMFAPDGTQAWGAVAEGGKAVYWLGAPSVPQQALLKAALQR